MFVCTKINKANRNLGIVFRTFTYMNLYKSIVRPHLENAATVCTPLFKKEMVVIENVQRRATKLVSTISHLTYQERLRCLGLPSLEYRRERADLVEVFKIMNDIDDVDKEKIFTVSTYTTRGHSLKLAKNKNKKRRHRLKVRSNSFSIRVIDSWNALPGSVIMAPSLNCFKSRLNSHWKKNTPASSIPGVISPDQNLGTITRMHLMRLYSLFRCSSYVSYIQWRLNLRLHKVHLLCTWGARHL